MRVLLVDADSKKGFPNLALMKISAYQKSLGRSVDLIKGIPTTAPLNDYDCAFVSTIFFQNKEKVQDYVKQLSFPVRVGGSGWNYTELPNDIEHIMPDYSLYDTDFSIGFTSRGCIRKCPWCIVPEKEGKIKDHAPITEFHLPEHKKIVLLDNNFFASPKWLANLEYIIDNGLKVDFSQGLDIRTINNHMAFLLSQTKTYNWTFKTRGFHIAFDEMRAEKGFRSGIEILLNNGIPSKHIMVYVLVGFNTTLKQDLKRIEIIRSYGAKPYIMRYNQTKDEKLKHLARWVNRKYYEWVPIDEYNGGVITEGL